jgi:hypothetical protein
MTTERPPKLRPPGDATTLWRATLETGSSVLQTRAPLESFDIYVVGFHCAATIRTCTWRRITSAHR